MISGKMMDHIERMGEIELLYGDKEFGNFRSAHEGYAVMLEELEELKTEVRMAEHYLEDVWSEVKQDNVDSVINRYNLNSLKTKSKMAIAEAIQLYAMTMKFERDCVKSLAKTEDKSENRKVIWKELMKAHTDK